MLVVGAVQDSRVFSGWEQQCETERQRQRPGFRDGEPEEKQPGFAPEPIAQCSGHQLFLTTDGIQHDFKQCVIEPKAAKLIATTGAHGHNREKSKFYEV